MKVSCPAQARSPAIGELAATPRLPKASFGAAWCAKTRLLIGDSLAGIAGIAQTPWPTAVLALHPKDESRRIHSGQAACSRGCREDCCAIRRGISYALLRIGRRYTGRRDIAGRRRRSGMAARGTSQGHSRRGTRLATPRDGLALSRPPARPPLASWRREPSNGRLAETTCCVHLPKATSRNLQGLSRRNNCFHPAGSPG